MLQVADCSVIMRDFFFFFLHTWYQLSIVWMLWSTWVLLLSKHSKSNSKCFTERTKQHKQKITWYIKKLSKARHKNSGQRLNVYTVRKYATPFHANLNGPKNPSCATSLCIELCFKVAGVMLHFFWLSCQWCEVCIIFLPQKPHVIKYRHKQ